MKIGYLTFGRDDFGYGLALCLDRIKGNEIYRVTPKTAKLVDVLLFSCFWWEPIYLLADFMRQAGIKKSDPQRPRIIVGGFNTFNPVPFMAYADVVVCGDGEKILPQVLDGFDPGFTWHNAPAPSSFCHETNRVARIELARGCKFRCRFCAVAHLKPYRETPFEDIEGALRTTRTKRVSLFAPEPTLYSRDDEVTALCHKLGKTRVDSDVRLDRLSNRSDSVPRVGIEGLSERLRKSVGKPYSNDKIIEAVRQAISDGQKGLFMYFILDLPGEVDEDWEEARALFRKLGELPGANQFILKPSPSVFMPSPHTPMEFEGIHYERDYQKKWSEFFGRGEDRNWEIIMVERSRVFSPAMRILSMISTRVGEEFFEIEEELSRKKIIGISGGRVTCKSLNGLLGVLKKHGGPKYYCGPRSPEGNNPWKVVTIC